MPKKKAKARTVKKSAVKAVKAPAKKEKPIGEITHFFSGIGVGIFKFKSPVKIGARIAVRGATTDFEMTIGSMQFDHKEISAAKKGQEIGIKLPSKKKVREGDSVYAIK